MALVSARGVSVLWTCPKCGAKFVTRKMPHSCGRATLDDWTSRMGPRARALFDRFEALVEGREEAVMRWT